MIEAPQNALHGIVEAAATLGEVSEIERALVDIMEQLRDCSPEARHAELVAWTRSPWWQPALMIACGWHGALARDAYRALRRDLDADTPGRRWYDLDRAVGRASIIRLLSLTDSPVADYAALPFRTWTDDGGRSWIAGAVGCPPMLDRTAGLAWLHLDIRDVILWDPATNETRIAGEHRSVSAFVLPDQPDLQLTIWGDGGAFFRVWAARRARTADLACKRARGEWAHPVVEPADGNLPGGLLVGKVADARWPAHGADTVMVGEGVTAAELHACAARTLMPRIAGAALQ